MTRSGEGTARPTWNQGRTWHARMMAPLAIVLAAVSLLGTTLIVPPARAAACEVPETAQNRSLMAERALPTVADAAVIQIEGENGVATPASLPLGSPAVATPVAPAPDPIETLTADLTAVSEALAACLSAGESETVVALAGERYLGQLFGSSVPLAKEDYLAVAAELAPIPARIVGLEDVTQPSEERAVAIVTQVVGNQLMRAEWTFEPAPRGDRPAGTIPWRLAGERQLPVPSPPDAAALDVEIGDRSFTFEDADVSGPDVVLRGENDSGEDHEMLVLRLAPGYTTADFLRATGPDLPQGVTFVGELPVRANDEANLVLVDLEPGVYTLVCLFPDAQGTPHLAQGMEASFTVE